MNALSIRFLIGLRKPGETPLDASRMADSRADAAYRFLARRYHALGFYRGEGAWKGAGEPCATAEVLIMDATDQAGEDVGRAQYLARRLADLLGQEAVGLVVTPVRFTLEGAHDEVAR